MLPAAGFNLKHHAIHFILTGEGDHEKPVACVKGDA
jgi:hypothetical protein